MTSNTTNDVNSGVQTNIGMDFQKHATIYLFLEKYESLKHENYFIILEHHEDIVFGYLNAESTLTYIETYQAKKSTSKWTVSQLYEIIKKIVATSQTILDDDHAKTDVFEQQNYFATNNTIEIQKKIKKHPLITQTINETNEHVPYVKLESELQDLIKGGNSAITFDSKEISHLETLHFRFIDLSRSSKNQVEQLHGKFISVFGNSIHDHKAALDTFIHYLGQISSTFNQGNIASLKDNSKRINSSEINRVLQILTTKKLAFDFWRDKGTEICSVLNISIFDKSNFELHYENSFDKFKDLNESEHRKVLTFVKENVVIFQTYTSDQECINEFYKEFIRTKNTTLLEIQLKSAISAAYIEIRNTL